MKFGIEPQHFSLLHKVVIAPLQAHGANVWIFGSRATGKHGKFSDVDILYEVIGGSPLPHGLLFSIQSELEETNFPYKLDLVDRAQMASSYREQVEREKLLI